MLEALKQLIEFACEGLSADVKSEPIVAETMRNLYDGVPIDEVYKASILAARTLIEKDPDYTFATARLLLHTIFKEVVGRDMSPQEAAASYVDYFPTFVKKGVQAELLRGHVIEDEIGEQRRLAGAGGTHDVDVVAGFRDTERDRHARAIFRDIRRCIG